MIVFYILYDDNANNTMIITDYYKFNIIIEIIYLKTSYCIDNCKKFNFVLLDHDAI